MSLTPLCVLKVRDVVALLMCLHNILIYESKIAHSAEYIMLHGSPIY